MSIPDVLPPEAVTAPAQAMLDRAAIEPVVADQLADLQIRRRSVAEDLRLLAPHLPQLPDALITETYERIVEAENAIVGGTRCNRDYGNGTASVDNELLVVGDGRVLMDAQHATDPVRKASGTREAADHGTGGLGTVLAQDAGGRIVIARGRQTGNPNVDPSHPLKDRLLIEAGSRTYDAFFSVHGMRSGKVLSLDDPTEIHGVIGLGIDPTEQEYDVAERLKIKAKAEYDLRLVIGNTVPHLNFAQHPDWDRSSFWDLSNALVRDTDGQIGATRVAALMPTSTVSFMRRMTGLPSSQLEIARSLRLTPEDMFIGRDRKAVQVGVYLGYRLCRLALATR
jgi:hypothetical protein